MKKVSILTLLFAVSACIFASTKANTVVNNDSSPPTVVNVVNKNVNTVEISVLEAMPTVLSNYLFTSAPCMVTVSDVMVSKSEAISLPKPCSKEGTSTNYSCNGCNLELFSRSHQHCREGSYKHLIHTTSSVSNHLNNKPFAMSPVRYRIANSKVNIRVSSRV